MGGAFDSSEVLEMSFTILNIDDFGGGFPTSKSVQENSRHSRFSKPHPALF